MSIAADEDGEAEELDEGTSDDATEASLNKLEEHASSLGVATTRGRDEDGDPFLELTLPSGRDTRTVTVTNEKAAFVLLDLPLNEISFLGEYAAIVNRDSQTIEAAIEPAGAGGRLRLLRFFDPKISLRDVQAGKVERTFAHPSHPDVAVTLRPASAALQTLRAGTLLRRRLALEFSGLRLGQHDREVELLESLGNALLFKLDLAADAPHRLQRAGGPPPARRRRPKVAPPNSFYKLPRAVLDDDAVALYWYGRSAAEMPLLQYLAFYQVAEYFFPRYARVAAADRIRGVLKDPLFDPHDERHVGRVLDTLIGGREGYGDERAQLRAVVNSCTDPKDLQQFLTGTAQRKEHFSSKSKALTRHRLMLDGPPQELQEQVTQRIYDIRCAIVHTKGQAGDVTTRRILPYSSEADLLGPDIELVAYVSQRALINSARSAAGLT